MNAQSYYRHIRVAKLLLRHERVLARIESLNGSDEGSKLPCTSHLDDLGLHTATTEELTILIRAASNLAKNAITSAAFQVPTFYTSTKIFLGELRAVFSTAFQTLL